MLWTEGVVRHGLPNGLTLLAQRDASSPVVAVLIHVRAGYFDEPDQWVGISHVLEHMFFKGTSTREPGQIASDVQRLGGYVNASTIYDKTVYYALAPSLPGALERLIEIQADALTDAALDAGELGRELEVIIQEANRKLDTPGAVARETLYELLFQRHRMRRWRIGTEQGLRRLTAADLRAYYGTRYVPGRVIVGLVGALDVDRALALAETAFGGWAPAVEAVEPSPAEPDERRPVFRVLHGDVQRPIALMGWRTVGALHPDAPALDLAAGILGQRRGSRLYRAVRTPGLASGTSAMHYTPTEVGVFDIGLESEPATLDEAVSRSLAQVADLIDRGPSPAELERARALVAADWSRQYETMDGRAATFCQAEALGGFDLADQVYERLMDVSADAVRSAAGQYLAPDVAAGLLYLPEGGATTLTDGGWPVQPAAATVAPDAALTPLPTRTGAPSARSRPDWERTEYPGGVTHVALAGADVVVLPKPGSGLATVELYLPGLPDRETPSTAGMSRLFVRTTLRGAGGLSADELAQAGELLGGSITTGTGADGLGWGMTVRAGGLGQAADLLNRVALEPTLADADVAVERTLQASDARRVRDDMLRHPLQRVLRAAFPDDPYGLPSLGDPETVPQLSNDQVRAWAEAVRETRAVIVAVGDLSTDGLLEGLTPLMTWPGRQPRPDRNGSAMFVPGRGDDRRDKAQSALAMAFPAPPFGSPERYAIGVACALLSGLAGRLFVALRERRSLAYTVAAMPWLRRRAGAILTYIATAPEREDEAREAMLEELKRLTEAPVPAGELERAANYAGGSVEIAHQRGGSLAADLLDAWEYGMLPDVWEIPARYRAVTAAEVRDVAAHVFQNGARAEFVVRGTGEGVPAPPEHVAP